MSVGKVLGIYMGHESLLTLGASPRHLGCWIRLPCSLPLKLSLGPLFFLFFPKHIKKI